MFIPQTPEEGTRNSLCLSIQLSKTMEFLCRKQNPLHLQKQDLQCIMYK